MKILSTQQKRKRENVMKEMRITYHSYKNNTRNRITVDRETLAELKRRYDNPTSLISRKYSFEEFVQMIYSINY